MSDSTGVFHGRGVAMSLVLSALSQIASALALRRDAPKAPVAKIEQKRSNFGIFFSMKNISLIARHGQGVGFVYLSLHCFELAAANDDYEIKNYSSIIRFGLSFSC